LLMLSATIWISDKANRAARSAPHEGDVWKP
jgi:hypothetical protein